MAMSWPMPGLEPVTMATLSARRPGMRFLLDYLAALLEAFFAGAFFAAFFGALAAAFFVAVFFAADFVAGFCFAMMSERRVLAFSSTAWRVLGRFLPARLM